MKVSFAVMEVPISGFVLGYLALGHLPLRDRLQRKTERTPSQFPTVDVPTNIVLIIFSLHSIRVKKCFFFVLFK